MGVVNLAESLVGKVKYVFGAANIPGGKGDCSSFTQYVFKQNGVDIGRTTDAQWTKGTKVDKSNLQPGDLVFFQGTYRAGVSHVGIYKGNGQFIHNSSSKGVTVSNLNSSYYKQHWLGARRVSGVSAGGGGGSSGSTTTQTGTLTGDKGTDALKWWGDIAVILFIVVLIIMSVWFFGKSFGINLNPF